ncbi:MAG: cytochrome c3 family protein [Coriobacteriia bacterium]|nr:cytochrome c3 family protein [Coriobacteriia bacterium]
MTSRVVKVLAAVVVVLALGAAPALAYQESSTATDPALTAAYSCPTCHGLEAGVASPTVAPRTVPATWTWDSEAGYAVGSRKGPHGGFTTGTQKCQVCHSIHDGNSMSSALLPEATIAATCYTCHDGTGGGGVYGVIYQRTGIQPGGTHRIGYLNGNNKVDVPGGNSNGSSRETTFTGEGGSLTCTDCHSAHNSNTIAPFVGDRKRSSADVTTATATNRLLRIRPTTSETTVTVYGAGWCASCHKGSHTGTPHKFNQADSVRNYSSVAVLSGVNTSISVGLGPLGGNNFGYIMTDMNSGPGGHGGERPICQQCHEDSRVVGGDVAGAPDQFWVTPAQVFDAPLDGSTAGNPQFQNFPHETVNGTLTIEPDPALCLNCHKP